MGLLLMSSSGRLSPARFERDAVLTWASTVSSSRPGLRPWTSGSAPRQGNGADGLVVLSCPRIRRPCPSHLCLPLPEAQGPPASANGWGVCWPHVVGVMAAMPVPGPQRVTVSDSSCTHHGSRHWLFPGRMAPTGSKTVSWRRDPHKAPYPFSPLPPICTQRWLVSLCLSMCVHICDHAGAHECVLGVCVYTACPSMSNCVCTCGCLLERV